MKILKIVGIGFGVVVALVVAAMIIVPLVIDPNDYRDEITAMVKEQTGRELRIIEPMKLSVFPWIGIKLGKVEFSNAPGFGEQPFAAINSAQVKIRLLPLLSKRVEMDTIALDGLRLQLARNEAGTSNWDDLVKPAPAEEKPEQPAAEGDPLQALAGLNIGGVKVSNAALLWDDQQQKQRAEISSLNLTTGELNLKDPIPLTLELDFAANAPEVKGHLRFASIVGLGLKEQRYALQKTELDLDAQGAMFPGGQMNAKLRTDAEADLAQQLAKVSGLTIEALGSEIALEANAERILGEPAVKATLKVQVKDGQALTTPFAASLPAGFNAAALSGTTLALGVDLDLQQQTLQPTKLTLHTLGTALDVGVSGAKLLDGPQLKGDVQLKIEDGNKLGSAIGKMMPEGFSATALAGSRFATNYAVDLGEAQNLSLDDLKLALLDIELSGAVQGSQLNENPSFTGELKSNTFVPRDLLGKLKITLPEMADPNTLIKASFATGFDVGTDHAAINKLTVRFDQSTLSGSAAVKRFDKPILRYDLNLDELDVDRYLPPPPPEPVKEEP
ncbi:MAG TPA: AsmA family protein, partial [Gammaproteobacteria bacterium]